MLLHRNTRTEPPPTKTHRAKQQKTTNQKTEKKTNNRQWNKDPLQSQILNCSTPTFDTLFSWSYTQSHFTLVLSASWVFFSVFFSNSDADARFRWPRQMCTQPSLYSFKLTSSWTINTRHYTRLAVSLRYLKTNVNRRGQWYRFCRRVRGFQKKSDSDIECSGHRLLHSSAFQGRLSQRCV